jgi:hypothetical protein
VEVVVESVVNGAMYVLRMVCGTSSVFNALGAALFLLGFFGFVLLRAAV